MDRITEQLSQLQELSNEELSELEEAVVNEFNVAESQELTSQSVAQLSQLADAVEAVRAEQARRATEAQALMEAAAEAAARVKGSESASENANEAAIEENPEEETPVENSEVPSTDEPEVVVEVDDMDDEDEDEALKKPAVPSTAGVETTPEAELSTEDAVELSAEDSVDGAATELSADEAEDVSKDAEAPADEEAPEVKAEADEFTEEVSVDAELSSDSDAVAEASVQDDSTLSNQESTEATVTAAANGSDSLDIQAPAGHEPVIKPATTSMTIVAGADIPGMTAGTHLGSTLEVAEAFQKRLHTLRHVHGGDGEQHIVASLRQEFPEDRTLSANDPMTNTDRIQGVTSQEAIVAAAGVCLPLETKYDMGCDVGVTDRPVRDALARFGADRGGIRYFSAPTLNQSNPNFANATGFWRGDGTDPNSGTFHTYGPDRTTATNPADQKPCLELNCVEEQTAYIEAITLCLTFNNLTTRTFPELVKRQNDLALVAHARVAENALLAQIEAGSTQVQAQSQVVGATREILSLFEKASASYRFKHRMTSNTPLRAIIPVWVKNLLRADLALQMPGDGLELFDIAESKIDAWFKSRGINPTWHLDGVGPAAVDADGSGAGTAVAFEFPGNIEFALFAEGAWLYLDGGTLDLGVIRDSSLVATNQYKQFVETFEGVANIGCDSYWVNASYEPTGAAADLVDTSL